MMQALKEVLRKVLVSLRLPITKNISYDILTLDILKTVLKKNSVCIDIGAHKGEILQEFLRYAPEARHLAFEPIPVFFENLKNHFGNNADIFPFALSEQSGTSTFNYVLDDPAYSGLKERTYKKSNPRIEKIDVQLARLDDIVRNRQQKISLMKIDVEGGEMGVLRGSAEVLANDQPVLIFEFGKGAGDHYGTRPEDLFGYLTSFSYEIRTLQAFMRKKESLTSEEFARIFEDGSDYYFIASRHQRH